MTKRPIDDAQDNDLRLSRRALGRAAERARQIALRTGTQVVVSRNGAIQHVKPTENATVRQVGEPGAPYIERP